MKLCYAPRGTIQVAVAILAKTVRRWTIFRQSHVALTLWLNLYFATICSNKAVDEQQQTV